MEQKTNEKKVLVLSFLGVITLIAVVVGATFAYFTAQGGDTQSININANTSTTDNLSFQTGEAISLTATQENFGENMNNQTGSTTASAILTANNATNNATANYYLYLDVANNDFEYTVDINTPELILTIEDPNGTELQTLPGYKYVTSGDVSGFDITSVGDVIKIADNYEITSTSTATQTWNITITFVNLDSNQNANTGKSFNASLIIQDEPLQTKVNLANYITDTLYTVDGMNELYYHDGIGNYPNADQEAGDNSYRYSGANPNNYVCFGSDEETCPTDNLYRIIGVFNGQVKLIKSTPYSSISWDNSDLVGNENGSNNWPYSNLKTELNGQYLTSLGNFNLVISDSIWYLGGRTDYNALPRDFHNAEIGNVVYNGNALTDNAKIGLMYPSDYGYAASASYWNSLLADYDVSSNDNWLYLGQNEWTISVNSAYSYIVFFIRFDGKLSNNDTSYEYVVRPVFYLNKDVQIYEGDYGTISDPYRIVL